MILLANLKPVKLRGLNPRNDTCGGKRKRPGAADNGLRDSHREPNHMNGSAIGSACNGPVSTDIDVSVSTDADSYVSTDADNYVSTRVMVPYR